MKVHRIFFFIFIGNILSSFSYSQLFYKEKEFTRADTLRGTLSKDRSCYDVTFYHLDLKVYTVEKSINGFNKIFFVVTKATNRLQIDLFENMEIRKIILDDLTEVHFIREFNAVFINLKEEIKLNSKHSLIVFYSGQPIIGKMLPWDGGFKWTKDINDNQWIVVACQGTGASLWWPNKDHQSDEPDSMLISLSVPSNLMAISNGRLRSVKELRGGYHRYDWFVSYPINNYNVTLNIGNFSHFNGLHLSNADTLSLDYYVLPYNLEKAKKQFEQVNPMLNCYEKYFGKFPFFRDGYKLIETPYLGMEHQSAIAYGNKYKTGYSGSDYSGIGLDFDYIIIHESAHEWWGNSITSKDIADMWIHEGFASYAEVLYTECMYDSVKASLYVNAQRQKIRNDKPIIGPYGVNMEGSGDMYAKGSVMLNTIRHIINNDSVWFKIIRGIQEQFKYSTVNTEEIENYISENAKLDLHFIFEQYLRQTDIPTLEIRFKNQNMPLEFEYRWIKVVNGFNMPVIIYSSPGIGRFIYPTKVWQTTEIKNLKRDAFKDVEDLFYIKVKLD